MSSADSHPSTSFLRVQSIIQVQLLLNYRSQRVRVRQVLVRAAKSRLNGLSCLILIGAKTTRREPICHFYASICSTCNQPSLYYIKCLIISHGYRAGSVHFAYRKHTCLQLPNESLTIRPIDSRINSANAPNFYSLYHYNSAGFHFTNIRFRV